MKAVRVERFEATPDVSVQEVPDPVCGPGTVLVDVAAAGVNFADLLMARGSYQRLPDVPFTLGMEAAGIVQAVAADVDGLRVGDRVLALVADGAFAELLAAPAHLVVPIPNQMSLSQAGAFGLAHLTAHFGLVRRAALRPGETVLVSGVRGGVGHAAVQLASALGARVIAASRNVELATQALGGAADHIVSADPDRIRNEVLHVTDGHGADIVFDVVGGDLFTQLLRVTAWEGRMVVVGFASAAQNPIKPGHLLVKNISVSGVQVTDYYQREPQAVRDALTQMFTLYRDGRLEVPRPRQVPMERSADLLNDLAAGNLHGKAVLVIDGAMDRANG